MFDLAAAIRNSGLQHLLVIKTAKGYQASFRLPNGSGYRVDIRLDAVDAISVAIGAIDTLSMNRQDRSKADLFEDLV